MKSLIVTAVLFAATTLFGACAHSHAERDKARGNEVSEELETKHHGNVDVVHVEKEEIDPTMEPHASDAEPSTEEE